MGAFPRIPDYFSTGCFDWEDGRKEEEQDLKHLISSILCACLCQEKYHLEITSSSKKLEKCVNLFLVFKSFIIFREIDFFLFKQEKSKKTSATG